MVCQRASLLAAGFAAAATTAPQADPDCDRILLAAVLNPWTHCKPFEGACPSHCLSTAQGMLDACSGKYFTKPDTQEVVPFEPVAQIAVQASMVTAECQEPLLDLLLRPAVSACSCSDAVSLMTMGAALWCHNSSDTCAPVCHKIVEGVYTSCSMTETVSFSREAGEAKVTTHVAAYLMVTAPLLLSTSCRSVAERYVGLAVFLRILPAMCLIAVACVAPCVIRARRRVASKRATETASPLLPVVAGSAVPAVPV